MPSADQDFLNALKPKINATLSNLMTASKNHATSFGMSPVSLLDAAASHLSATIVDLVRLLKIRRTTGGSRMQLESRHEPMPTLSESAHVNAAASPPPPAPPTKPNGYLSGGMSSVKNALGSLGIGSLPVIGGGVVGGTQRDSARDAGPSSSGVVSPTDAGSFRDVQQSSYEHPPAAKSRPSPDSGASNSTWQRGHAGHGSKQSVSSNRGFDNYGDRTISPVPSQQQQQHSQPQPYEPSGFDRPNAQPVMDQLSPSYHDREQHDQYASPAPSGSAYGVEAEASPYGGTAYDDRGVYQRQDVSNGGSILTYGAPEQVAEQEQPEETNRDELKVRHENGERYIEI